MEDLKDGPFQVPIKATENGPQLIGLLRQVGVFGPEKPWENHGKTIGKPWENLGKPWKKTGQRGKSPGSWQMSTFLSVL